MHTCIVCEEAGFPINFGPGGGASSTVYSFVALLSSVFLAAVAAVLLQ